MNGIKNIIDKNKFDKIVVCLDTWHMHVSGIDISNVSIVLTDFAKTIGIKNTKANPLDDLKNANDARKDRYVNLGYG